MTSANRGLGAESPGLVINEATPTLADIVEQAIHRRAVMLQAEPGMFGEDVTKLRAQVLKTGVGSQAAALANSTMGSDAWSQVSETNRSLEVADAIAWVARWAPCQCPRTTHDPS